MAQSGKPHPSSHHKRSKVSKPPSKSSTKKGSDPIGSGSGAMTAASSGKPPNVTTKVKKSQKSHPNVASTAQLDVQVSPFISLPKTSNMMTSAPVQSTNEPIPFDLGANQPMDFTSQHKHTLEESSGSSSDSGSSSSSSGSSDSESEEESPTFVAVSSGGYPGSSGGGVNINPAALGHLTMPPIQASQPTPQGIYIVHVHPT